MPTAVLLALPCTILIAGTIASFISGNPSGPGKYNLIVFPYHEVVLLDAEELEEVAEGERRERPEGEVGEAVRGRRRGAALRERNRLHRHEILHQQVPLVVPERRL